jgi:hypothetical protein
MLAEPLLGGDELGLGAADFRMINRNGFGDGLNSYAHSMAWFEGCLYVGTTRGIIHMRLASKPLPDLKPWPCPVPKDLYDDLDRRAQIWRYDPRSGHWNLAYQAAQVPGRGREVPRYIGYRGMAVFKGAGDAKPCLYVSTWAPSLAEPPDILRSEDGRSFQVVARPPWDNTVRSFRTLQPFRGRIHTTPTSSGKWVGGVRQSSDSIGSESTIYCTDDIQTARWQPASRHGFGDDNNLTVFEMAEFNGQLYAGTVNPTGFQLWRTERADAPPYTWKKVLDRGAGRGAHNEVAVSLCEFNGALYVGTGILSGGFHQTLRIGPAASELLRVWPDDSWELLVGQPRETPAGVKVPLSGYGVGFDSLFNTYVWRMTAHAGWLYAGTFSFGSVLPYLPLHIWPEDVLVLLRHWGLDRVSRELGGFDLWRSRDGVRWDCVTRSGFGNQYNWGLRNFASTPYGLFFGTANPWGPTIAIQRHGRWQYVENPRGGCEVYLGRKNTA